MQTKIYIPINKPFDFKSALQSHGWVDLLPNIYNEGEVSFSRTQQLSSGTVVHFNVSSPETEVENIQVLIKHPKKITQLEGTEIKNSVRHMLRLDEDLEEFYALCKGKGYLLRSPDIFEELVKVIFTI